MVHKQNIAVITVAKVGSPNVSIPSSNVIKNTNFVSIRGKVGVISNDCIQQVQNNGVAVSQNVANALHYTTLHFSF